MHLRLALIAALASSMARAQTQNPVPNDEPTDEPSSSHKPTSTFHPSPKPTADPLFYPTNDPLVFPTSKPTTAVTNPTTTTSTNYRRRENLCDVSPDAAQANCEQDLELQLFCNFPSYVFKPSERGCKSGERFAGDTENGKVHITLVPGHGGNGTFAAHVNDDDTGGVYSINSDANGNMVVVERMQEDFLDMHEKAIDDDESFTCDAQDPDDTRSLEATDHSTTKDDEDDEDDGIYPVDFSVEKTVPMDKGSRALQDTDRTVKDEDNGVAPFDFSGEEMVPMDLLDGKEGDHSHRNLQSSWGLSCSVTSSSSIKCSWKCRRKRKDTVCWKESSDSGSPCRNGPGNFVYHVPSGGSKWKTCSYEIKNLKCQTRYDVRVRKNFFNYSTMKHLKTEGCPPTPAPPKQKIDVLVLWTSNAECLESGLMTGCTRTSITENTMRNLVDRNIADTNVAYDNSGIFAELSLARAQWFDYTEKSNKALRKIRKSRKVKKLRKKHNADLVSLIIDGGTCGVAYYSRNPRRRRMFSVVRWDCWSTFAHETGHNLGCKHDRGTENKCNPRFGKGRYNYGYRDPDAEFSSIMAYQCTSGCGNDVRGSCGRALRFSNTNYPYSGRAIGDAKNDNARQINHVAKKVAAFYPRPTCMAGNTGFTKVTGTGNTETTQLQDLQVGDNIIGLNGDKSVVEDCEVISLTSKGNATVYDKYTSDHYIVDGSGSTLVTQGEVGQQEDDVPVFQVLTSCPVVTDDSGKESTFSICGRALYENGPMPWSAYLKIHETMFNLVKATGIRSLCAFYDIDDAIDYLPLLCTSMFTCAESGECDEFEAGMLDFVNSEIVLDARVKVFSAFPQLGYPSVEGSVSYMVSKGKSQWGWYPDYASENCKRDGNHSPYFENNGWLEPSLESCCNAHFSWAYDVCVNGGEALSPSNKFFADFQSGRCVQDCEEGRGPFGCAPVPPPIVLYDSIETCCEIAQSWVNIDYCYSRSINGYSDGWVADYGGLKCAQDCPPEEGPPCSNPEHADPSVTIFATREECCSQQFSWIGDACIGKSNNTAYYSAKFYVYYIGSKCAQDCDPELGLPCMGNPPPDSGLAAARFDTAYACCVGKLWWLDVNQCVADTNGNA